jgi:hypothetical protein
MRPKDTQFIIGGVSLVYLVLIQAFLFALKLLWARIGLFLTFFIEKTEAISTFIFYHLNLSNWYKFEKLFSVMEIKIHLLFCPLSLIHINYSDLILIVKIESTLLSQNSIIFILNS